MATYTKIPSLNTTNPIGFFNSFIAVVGSLGCSHALHSPSGHIDDIPDLKIAHGIDAEKYLDEDHKDYGRQKEAKARANKIIDAAAKLAGFIRVAASRDPAAMAIVNSCIGMTGQDGIGALKALPRRTMRL